MWILKNSLLFTVVITIANGLPNTFQCARYCKEEGSNFGYEQGNTYYYSYNGIIRTFINGTNSLDETKLTFDASVAIYVYDDCNFAMKLADSKLTNGYISKNGQHIEMIELDDMKNFQNKLHSNLLYFSFNNGKIDTICHTNNEDKDILDIKRGILSSFQNSAQSLKSVVIYETDISGNCETVYDVTNRDLTFTTMRKRKNFQRCNQRLKKTLSFQSVPYLQKQTATSQPILKSAQECVQKYNGINILMQSDCNELHRFQPFSHGENGALSQITQTLSLKNIDESVPVIPVSGKMQRNTLLYEEAEYNNQYTKNIGIDGILRKLADLEENSKDGINEKVPGLFSQLVDDLKYLDNTSLNHVFQIVEKTPAKKKFYLDAISLVNNANSISVIINLFQMNKVSIPQMNSFITSLAFITSPTIEIIRTTTPLLQLNSKTRQSSVLAISSLVHSYCQRDKNCYDQQEIADIAEILTRPLEENHCIPTSAENFKELLLMIKGLENAGMESTADILEICYKNEDTRMELRLAAITALQRVPCQFKHNNLNDFTKYFANQYGNSELRITAYLATMRCLSHTLFFHIKDVLLREETNQVGSFVWTHLTNLQETSTQWKQNARQVLANDFLRNKFHTDVRKYSRNYEASTFFERLGLGAGLESNVIFTQDSYLPKSGMVNLTLDVFGESVNLLELGSRVEGFEDIVENLFSPSGYFPEKSIQNLLHSARMQHENTTDNVKELGGQFLRQKTLLQTDPTGILYAKIFGNEIAYHHFSSLAELTGDVNPKSILDVVMQLFRENDVEYSKSVMLLDSSYRVPTGLGFPLELSVKAAAAIGLNVKGKVDLQNLWSYKLAVEGKIYPSAAIELCGDMIIHTPLNKCGLRSISTLNTNTYIDGHIFVNNGKVIDAKINMPKDQTNILKIESNIHVIADNKYPQESAVSEVIRDISDNIQTWRICTGNTVSTVTGIELCYNAKYINASMEYDAPYFPLTGGFKYAITLRKTDTFDSYDLKLKLQNKEKIYAASLYLNTPNSTINRQIKASYNLDGEQYSMNAKLLSPFASMEINSKIGDDNNKYAFHLRSLYNDREVISMDSSFKVTNVGRAMRFEPSAKVNFQRKQIAAVTGSISYVKDSKYNADLKLEGLTAEPISVVGEISNDVDLIEAKATLSSKLFNGKLYGSFQNKPSSLGLSATAHYNFNSTTDYETLMVQLKTNKVRLGILSKDSLLVKLKSSEKPIYDTLLAINSQRSQMYFDSSGVLSIFGITWETNQLLKLQRPRGYLDMAFMCTLSCKQSDIDYRVILSHNSSETEFNIHSLAQLNTVQRLEGIFRYTENLPANRTSYLLFYYPKNTITLDGAINSRYNNQYDILLNGYYDNGETKKPLIIVTGDYTNSSTTEKKQYTLNSNIDIPQSGGKWNTPWKLTSFIDSSNKQIYSVSDFLTTKVRYFTKIDWTDNTFYTTVKENDNDIILVDTVNSEHNVSFLIGVNIYQHFEASTTLIKPADQFSLKFYWDKDRDLNKKVKLEFKKDLHQGLYLMNLEYPNEIIGASFVLLPTQVTMNVTWGVEISKRLYLKVGNQIMDDSGIWFGELETPFEYLEKQTFKAKYFVLANKFKVESDISWRAHSVSGEISGCKSDHHITGKLLINTTLEEIEKIGATLSYTREILDHSPSLKGEAKFTYNSDEIVAQTFWQPKGLNVTGNLSIVSPTGTIQPIIGLLVVGNSDRINTLNSSLSYRGKRITAQYRFEDARSFIRVNTPFEWIEKTDFEYAVVVDRDKLVLELTLDIFKQRNHALLMWNNTEHAMNVKVDFTSPITGSYMTLCSHSTRLGYLDERFILTHGDNNQIVGITIQGGVIPLLDMHVTIAGHMLNNTASLVIKNTRFPAKSDIAANWNDNNIRSTLTVSLTNQAVQDLRWELVSNMLDSKIKFHYLKSLNTYCVIVNLLKGYKLRNNMTVSDNYTEIENNMIVHTSTSVYSINYLHLLQLHDCALKLNIRNDKDLLATTFHYSYNQELQFLNALTFNMTTPYHDKVNFQFLNTKVNLTDYDSYLALQLGQMFYLTLKSAIQVKGSGYELSLVADAANISTINLRGSFEENPQGKLVKMLIDEDGHVVNVSLNFRLEKTNGLTALSVISSKYGDITDTLIKYNFTQPRKEIMAAIKLPCLHKELNFTTDVFKDSTSVTSNLLINSNIQHMNIVDVQLSLSPYNGFVLFKSNKKINWNYNVNILEISHDFTFKSELNNEFFNSSNFNFDLALEKDQHNNRKLEIKFSSSIYNISSSSGYEFDRKHNEQQYSTTMNTYFKSICVNQFNESIIDLDVIIKGELLRTDKNGVIQTKFVSNIPNLNYLEVSADYVIDKHSYDINANLNYLEKSYKFVHNLKLYESQLKFIFYVNTVADSDIGTIKFDFDGRSTNNNYVVKMNFTKNLDVYNVEIDSNYNTAIQEIKSEIQIKIPKKEMKLVLNIKVLGANKYIKLEFPFENAINKLDISMDHNNWYNFKLKAEVDFPAVNLDNYTLEVLSNFSEAEQTLLAKYSKLNQMFTLNINSDNKNVDVFVSTPEEDKFIQLTGHHNTDLTNFTINYNILYNAEKYNVQFLHVNRHYTRTLLDIKITTLGLLNRLFLFESKIDKYKTRASMTVAKQYMSVLVQHNAFFTGRDVLLFELNGEPLFILWSGADQTYIMTTTKYGIYRLTLDYMQDPRIWAFTILKNGDNFISFLLHDNSNGTFVNFRGRLEAPNIITDYPRLTFQLRAERFVGDYLKIAVMESGRPLMHLQWTTEINRRDFTGELKFNSSLAYLQSFEQYVQVNVTSDLSVVSRTSFRQFDQHISVLQLDARLPKNSTGERKIDVLYPCEAYGNCTFYLNLKPKLIDFYWTSPVENWKNVTFKANTKLDSASGILGEVHVKLNNKFVTTSWLMGVGGESASLSVDFRNNVINNLDKITLDVLYNYYRYLQADCGLANVKNTLNISLDSKESHKAIICTLTAPSALIMNSELALEYKSDQSSEKYQLEMYGNLNGESLFNFNTMLCKNCVGSVAYYTINLNIIKYYFYYEIMYNYPTIKNVNSTYLFDFKGNSTKSLLFEPHVFSIRINEKNKLAEGSVKIKSITNAVDITWNFKNIPMTGEITVKLNNISYYAVYRIHNSNEHVISFFEFVGSDISQYHKLIIHGKKYHDGLKGSFVLDAPIIQAFETLNFDMTSLFAPDRKYINFTCNTSFSKTFTSRIDYTKLKDTVNIVLQSSYGDQEVCLTTDFIPTLHIKSILKSPFPGYTTGELTATIDYAMKTIHVNFSKELLRTELIGYIDKSTDNLVEANLIVKDSVGQQNETIVQALIKLDHENMKGFANIRWIDQFVDLGLSYNPKSLGLQIRSPFSGLTDVSLTGKYQNEPNDYNVEIDGTWNQIAINFSGVFKNAPHNVTCTSNLKAGDLYQGEFNLYMFNVSNKMTIDLNGYFPNSQSNVYMKYDSNSDDGIKQFTIKTPFEDFQTLNVDTRYNSSSFTTYMVGNIGSRDFVSYNSVALAQNARVQSTLTIALPAVDIKWIFNTDLDFTSDGVISFCKVEKKTSYNATVSFVRQEFTTLVSTDVVSQSTNFHETLLINYDNRHNTSYGFNCLNNSVAIQYSPDNLLNLDIHLKLPYFSLNEVSVVMLLNENIGGTNKLSFVLNDKYINGSLNKLNNNNIESVLDINSEYIVLTLNVTTQTIANAFKITANVNHRNTLSRLEIFYVNDDDTFEINSTVSGPDMETDIEKLHIAKNLNKIYLYKNNNFVLDMDNNENNYYILYNNTVEHLAFINVTTDCIVIGLNTPLLEEHNLQISVTKFVERNIQKFNIKYHFFEMILYDANLSFEVQEKSYEILGNLIKLGVPLYDLKGNLNIDDSAFKANIYVHNSSDDLHSLSILFEHKDPFVVELNVFSVYIPLNGLFIYANISHLSHGDIYVGSPKSKLLLHEKYFTFSSEYSNNTYKLQYEAPTSNYITNIDVDFFFNITRNYMFRKSLLISSELLGEVRSNVRFSLDDLGLILTTDLELPFMEHFEEFHTELRLPRRFGPYYSLTLPNGKNFGAHLIQNFSTDYVTLSMGYHWPDVVFNLDIDTVFEDYKLVTELIFPAIKCRNLKIIVNHKNAQLDTINSVALNDHSYELKYRWRNEIDHKYVIAVLTTPHFDYHKYSIEFEIKENPEKIIKCFMYYPGLDRVVGVNFAMSYLNSLTFKIDAAIGLPLAIHGIDFFELSILDELNNNENDGILYVLECSSRSNKHNISVNVDAVDIAGFKELLVNVTFNNDTFYSNIVSIGQSIEDLRFKIDLNTSLFYAKSLYIFLNSSTDIERGLQSGMSYNKLDIINFDFHVDDRLFQVTVDNIWKPIGLQYKFVNEDEQFVALATVCYNLEEKETSTLGGNLVITKNISSTVYLSTRTVKFSAEQYLTDSDTYYMTQLSWNSNDSIGLEIYNYNSTAEQLITIRQAIKLEIPFNRIELLQEAVVNFDSLSMNTISKLLWGKERSEIALYNHLQPGKIESTLHATPLAHDVILTIDMSRFHTIPSIFKASLQYSHVPEKKMQFEMVYNKNIDTSHAVFTERNFIFKHPIAKIDHGLYFNTLRSHSFTNGSVVINYHNYELDQPDIMKASICVYHDSFKVKGIIETSRNTLSIVGASKNVRESKHFIMSSVVNNREPLEIESIYDYSKDSPSISITTSYGEDKRYHLYAGLPSSKEFRTQLKHVVYDEEFTDLMFALKLNSSQLLWLKVQWQHELLPQFHKIILQEYSDIKYIVEATGKQLIDVLNDNVGKEMVKDFSDMRRNVTGYYNRQLKDAVDDKLSSYIKNGYKENAFYSQRIKTLINYIKKCDLFQKLFDPIFEFVNSIYTTIESIFKNAARSMKQVLSVVSKIVTSAFKDLKDIKNIKTNAKLMLKAGINQARKSLKNMENVAIHLLDNINDLVTCLKTNIEEFFDPCLKLLDKFIQYVEQQLTIVQLSVMNTMDTIQKYLINLREIKEMLAIYSTYINWLEDLHLTRFLEPVGDIIEHILETIITDIKHVVKLYKPYIEAVTEAAFGNYEGIRHLPPIAEMKKVLNRVYQKTVWIWNYNNMTKVMKNMVSKYTSELDGCLAYIVGNEEMINGDFEYALGQAGYKVKPEAGLIEISQPLPVEWDAFDMWPRFEQHYVYQKIKNKFDMLYRIFGYRYWDVLDDVFRYLEDLSDISLAPPINNVGMLIGSSHYVTFNDKHFKLNGQYSYLLAGDFSTNAFSIIANYNENQTKKSLSVIIADNIVEVFPNYTVTLNGNTTDLPVILDSAYIIRDNENIIVESPKRFSVDCNLHYDYCAVELSGWLFGKTAGLLGTLDNEQESDMVLPDGRKVAAIDEFAHHWRIKDHGLAERFSTSAKNATERREHFPLRELMVDRLCEKFFEELKSPLFHCFQQVDPSPYLKICSSDMREQSKPTVCRSVGAYIEKCAKHRVNIKMPHICLSCEINGQSIGIEEEIFDGHNPKSIDVLFLKQSGCHEDNYDLTAIPAKLESALVKTGYLNNRYAFITYGGKSILNKPHFHTMYNEIWTTSSGINLNRNIMEESKLVEKFQNSQTTSNAIDFALKNLNLRPAVLNMFVLMHCEEDLILDNSAQLYTKLSNKDIILHVLKSKPFANLTEPVFGINANGFVIADDNTLKVDSEKSNEIITKLTDSCKEIALGTNGTITDIDGFIERPDFAQSWSNLVAKSARQSPCQKCKCEEGRHGFGKIECTRCISPAVKRILDEYEFSRQATTETEGTV